MVGPLHPGMAAGTPDGEGRWTETRIGEIADGDRHLVGGALRIAIDAAAADRAEVIVDRATGVGAAAIERGVALDGRDRGLGPVAPGGEDAARLLLTFEAMADQDPERIALDRDRQLAARAGGGSRHGVISPRPFSGSAFAGCDPSPSPPPLSREAPQSSRQII